MELLPVKYIIEKSKNFLPSDFILVAFFMLPTDIVSISPWGQNS